MYPLSEGHKKATRTQAMTFPDIRQLVVTRRLLLYTRFMVTKSSENIEQ